MINGDYAKSKHESSIEAALIDMAKYSRECEANAAEVRIVAMSQQKSIADQTGQTSTSNDMPSPSPASPDHTSEQWMNLSIFIFIVFWFWSDNIMYFFNLKHYIN